MFVLDERWQIQVQVLQRQISMLRLGKIKDLKNLF